MSATMYGWEIVCPQPIGSAASVYASSCSSFGTKSSRGIRAIAASTASSPMPRPRSWRSTIDSRDSTRTRHSEMVEDGGHDLRDSPRRRVDADREKRNEGVGGDERAVAPAAQMVAAAEVDELPALRRRDEQLAGVRVRERG